MKRSENRLTVRDMAYIAMFAALMAICAWITVPMAVPFTLQTFAMFLCAAVLGPRRGCLSVLLYILLGAVGLPVFSGFSGGAAALVGPTGGYIVGFLPMVALTGALLQHSNAPVSRLFVMCAGLVVCYAFGTVWFLWVYTQRTGPIGLFAVLSKCVFPFIVPDLAKLILAEGIARRLAPVLEKGTRRNGK